MSQPSAPTAAPSRFDVHRVRQEFPILGLVIRDRQLVYLDNAATTQKPRAVLDALTRYYTKHNANIHRGVHYLSETATEAYEAARRTAQQFLNAREPREVIFTRNATEGINLVAQTFGRRHIGERDEIVITGMERNGTSLTRLYRNTDGILLLDEGNSEALINAHNGDLAWGDVDNDGDLDLALSGENIIPEGGLTNVTEFYLNETPGTPVNFLIIAD